MIHISRLFQKLSSIGTACQHGVFQWWSDLSPFVSLLSSLLSWKYPAIKFSSCLRWVCMCACHACVCLYVCVQHVWHTLICMWDVCNLFVVLDNVTPNNQSQHLFHWWDVLTFCRYLPWNFNCYHNSVKNFLLYNLSFNRFNRDILNIINICNSMINTDY